MDNRIEALITSIGKLRDYENTRDDLISVKSSLNALFTNANCTNFIYTLNTDKLPFGCIVFPNFDSDIISSIMVDGSPVRFDSYEIELDSKVFDYGLTDEEIAAIIMYNIHHMTSNMIPYNRLREYIDEYFMNRDEILVLKNSIQYEAILAFGLSDTLNQLTSCLYLPDEIESDAFLDSLELNELKDGLNKLYKEIPGCENETTREPKLNMLSWALRLYNNVEDERIPAIHTMNKCKSISASVLYTNRMNAIINALNRIDTDYYVNESVVSLCEQRRRGFLASLRYSGLRDIENDLYEYAIRAKNAESEEDVYYALKQINARLVILDDYIRNNQGDPDIDRWIALKNQYIDIRNNLAKHAKIRHKGFGIAIDYDKLEKDDQI